MKKSFLPILILGNFALLTCTIPACAGTVTVSFSSPTLTFTNGQVLSVNLLANLPDPVLGFGVDVEPGSSKLSLTSAIVGPLWFPGSGSQSDDVYGLAFPVPISGSGVLLARLTFTALGSGSSTLIAAYDSRNLAEGFPLVTGGYDPNNLANEAPQVPEPAAPLLVGFGILSIVRIRNRRSQDGRALCDQ